MTRKLFAALIFLFVFHSGLPAAAQTSLFTTLSPRAVATEAKHAGVQSYAIRLNAAALVPGSKAELLLPIPRDSIAVQLEPISPETLALPRGQSAWRGTIAGGGGSVFILMGKGWVRGQIEHKGQIYSIRGLTKGPSFVDVVDPKRAFPREHPENYRAERYHVNVTPKQPVPTPDCNDPPNQVDLMVLYTAVARASAGGQVAMEAEVAFAVAQANLAYVNSGVAHRLNLVFTGEVDYPADTASLTFSTALGNLQNTGDGVLDNVATLRDAHKADLVSLITENGDACGLGYFIEPPSAAADIYGYSVVLRSCAGGNFSLAHETGHNLAADHDRPNAGGHTSYDFDYGHIQPVPTGASPPWRTVMSYPGPCNTMAAGGNCARLAYFSTASASVGGDPAGVADGNPMAEDNVAALNLAAPTVSKFRCRTPGPNANIWMKDLWEDTGAEPDPNTAGKPMWESPYIWNRTSQDTTLIHQHEHQNPTIGLSNYVYVKIHNDGGASANGQLELYWAQGSTNLNDPAMWHQFGSQAETLTPGTRVVEFPWSSLPGTGHYCVMARWNENGTPLSFSDIDYAVRYSNDMVWRNMNIDTGDVLPSPDLTILARGTPRGEPGYLVFTTQALFGENIPWSKIGRVEVTVDPALLTRAEGHGAKDGRFVAGLGADPLVVGPLQLKPGQPMKIGLRIPTDAALAKKIGASLKENAVMAVRVIQANKRGAEALAKRDNTAFKMVGWVVGGVTYNLTIPSRSGKDPTAHPPGQ